MIPCILLILSDFTLVHPSTKKPQFESQLPVNGMTCGPNELHVHVYLLKFYSPLLSIYVAFKEFRKLPFRFD